MKKPSTPQLVYSSPTQLKSDFQSTTKFRCKIPSALGYIIAAAKKVTRVFRVFLPGKRKATSNGAAPDDASKRNIQVKHLSCKSYRYATITKILFILYWWFADSTDQSTGSYTTNSYASSGSISGQFAAVNFSFEEIYKATEKFSAANIIGEGGFGTVYKGKLKDGSIVAAKRAKKVQNYACRRMELCSKSLISSPLKVWHCMISGRTSMTNTRCRSSRMKYWPYQRSSIWI